MCAHLLYLIVYHDDMVVVKARILAGPALPANSTIEGICKMPGNSSHAGIRKIQVQTYLRSSLCCCMGVVAKLFLLWREGKEKSASIFCGYAENGKFFLFSGFNRDKMVVWGF